MKKMPYPSVPDKSPPRGKPIEKAGQMGTKDSHHSGSNSNK